MPIAEAITAVGKAMEVVTAMRTIEKNFDAAAYKVQIAELMTALADAKIELITARETSLEQTAEIDRLRTSIDERRQLVEGPGGFKYAVDEEGLASGYPVCPTCEQRNARVVKLVSGGLVSNGRCPVCEAKFERITVYARDAQGNRTTLEAIKNLRDAEGMDEMTRRMRSAIPRWP